METNRVELITSAKTHAERTILGRVFAEILRPTFNTDELPDEEYLLDQFGTGQEVAVMWDGSTPVAVAAFNAATVDKVSLLSYLATAPSHRGSGLGSKMFDFLKARWTELHVGLVLGEVHDPRLHAEGPDEHPYLRLDFYARQGCEVLDIPWIQPALDSQSARVGGMLLVAMFRSVEQMGLPTVEADLLRSWANDYYNSSNGELSDGPPPQFSNRLAESETVAVLPLELFEEVVPFR